MHAAELNDVLAAEHPGCWALLSPLGRRAALPLGIPQQSAQARDCQRKATMGQITDGSGLPLTLPSIARYFDKLDPRAALLYAPQHGLAALRAAWRAHIEEPDTPASLPIVTAGMTHGLSLCAELFTSPDVPLLVAAPYWDNYDTIFQMRVGAPVHTWPFFDASRSFNTAGLAALLARQHGPSAVLLNFPANPTGYSPRADEVPELVRVLTEHPHPLCVICDDAYNGLYFGEGLYGRSLFGELSRRADPRRTVICRVDGATKELVFFGGRVGFLTFSVNGAAGAALEEKAAALLRGAISSVSAPAQAAVLGALASPTLQEERVFVHAILAERYRALRDALTVAGVETFPFNSGCFALVPLPRDRDCEQVRRRLIAEQSVGVIAIPSENALRVAFCSIEAVDIPDLVSRLVAVIR